jgi:hypothetical protein
LNDILASGTSHPLWQIPLEVTTYSALVLLVFFAGQARGERPVVQVWLPVVTNRNVAEALLRARIVVTEAYAEIGVDVVWRSARAAPSGCSLGALNRGIIVTFASIAPAGLTQEALAFATPFATDGPCVTVLMDRIAPSAERNPASSGFLLGNALAHEMGHVLQRVVRHSDSGLMKARWSGEEIRNMRTQRLHFTVYDAELIMSALAVQAIREPAPRKAMATRETHQSFELVEEVK